VTQKEGFQQWVDSHKLQQTDDYDLKAAYDSGVQPDERGHLPDTFKKPNHITFSDESKFNDGGAGHWNKLDNGKWEFTPGPTNLKYHSVTELQNYFKKYEPDAVLNLGAQRADATGNLDLDGPQGFGDILRETQKMAPNGIPWEQWRQSTNIESGPTPSPEQVQKNVDDAYEESKHDGEPDSFLGAIKNLITGKDKFVDDGTRLTHGDIADLLNGVDNYIKTGGPQKDLAEYHKSADYQEREAIKQKIIKIFQERFPEIKGNKIEDFIKKKTE
jgi:hypothetical protein